MGFPLQTDTELFKNNVSFIQFHCQVYCLELFGNTGAIVGLHRLGNRAARTLIVPHAETCMTKIQPLLDQMADMQSQCDAFFVYKALQTACASCLYASVSDE